MLLTRFTLSLALALSATGCVTSGNEGGVFWGAVALSSSIAKAAQSDDSNAKSVWCQTLDSVDRVLLDTPEASLTAAERTNLQLEIEPLAKQNGYRLHAIQIDALISDAAAVLGNLEARTAALSTCDQIEP